MAKAILFLAVTGFSWVSVGAVIGHIERRGLNLTAYQFCSCLICIGFGVASWAAAPDASFPRSGCPVSTWVGVLSGTLLCGTFEYLMVRAMGLAMRRGPNAIVWAIVQSGLIYPFLMGSLVFGVPMGPRRLAGIALIVASVFLYASRRKAGNGNDADARPAPNADLRQWLPAALLGMLCCGINQCGANLPSYLEKGQEFSAAFRTLCIYLGILATALAHLAVRAVRGEHGAPPSFRELRTLAGYAAVVGSVSFMTSRYLRFPGLDALEKHGAGSLGYPIMVAACIVGFIIYGVTVLRERPTRLQLLGTAFALAGIALISA